MLYTFSHVLVPRPNIRGIPEIMLCRIATHNADKWHQSKILEPELWDMPSAVMPRSKEPETKT